ncbi:MAG: chemotaxis protein CheB, partial [Bdellovibrio sp.]
LIEGESAESLDKRFKSWNRKKRFQSKKTYKMDLICIGSSTGGFPVVQNLLKGLSFKETMVVVCQHIGAGMEKSLKDSLMSKVQVPVRLVQKRTPLKKGEVYLLAGGQDFVFKEERGELILSPSPSQEIFHPSINVLTQSMLDLYTYNMAVFILSGLGNDGSRYLKQLKDHGVRIFAQDPSTAKAPSMPENAIRSGATPLVYKEEEMKDVILRGAA